MATIGGAPEDQTPLATPVSSRGMAFQHFVSCFCKENKMLDLFHADVRDAYVSKSRHLAKSDQCFYTQNINLF